MKEKKGHMMLINNSSNFREIAIGNISPGLLYRSNHPISGEGQVKEIILASNIAQIKTIINLCDSYYSLQSKIVNCPWYKKKFDENSVIALNVNMQFDIMEKTFLRKMGDAMTFMIDHEPPYLIHCIAGIDRTGFLSVLIESFMGAKYDDMVKDYVLSYVNNSDYSHNDHKNGSIFLDNLFSKMKGNLFNSNDEPQLLAIKYLKEKVKINDNTLLVLEKKLSTRGG